MKKECVILIMEPERIIGLELQVLLENDGYSVLQYNAAKLADELKNKQKIKIIIVNIDKAKADDFLYIKNNFCPSEVSVIGISSGKQVKKEIEGVSLTETFLKPFESKHILSFINKCCAVSTFK